MRLQLLAQGTRTYDRDTLGAMAYFCLTVLENSTGHPKSKRKHAAKYFNVDEAVLKHLGKLTHSKGGRDARKGHGVAHDFSLSERMWIELIVKRLIRRAAEVAHDPNQKFSTITLGRLPM